MIFNRTKIYTVHVLPEVPLAQQVPVFIREGFNIWAFIFGPLWALYHRLWLAALGLALVAGLFAAADKKQWLAAPIIFIVQLAFNIAVGYQANDWRRAKLTRKGFITGDISASDSKLRAQQRYYERVMAAA